MGANENVASLLNPFAGTDVVEWSHAIHESDDATRDDGSSGGGFNKWKHAPPWSSADGAWAPR